MNVNEELVVFKDDLLQKGKINVGMTFTNNIILMAVDYLNYAANVSKLVHFTNIKS